MWGRTRSDVTPVWKAVEDDFVMGACAHRIVGFASRGADASWSAFDEESQPIGVFPRLIDAQTAIWSTHTDTHERHCAVPRTRVWVALTERARAAHR